MLNELFSNEENHGAIVFSISEESAAGGSSYCWVKSKPDGFHLYGSELGHMFGPAPSAPLALHGSGFEFGMEFMDIVSSLTPSEFGEALKGIELSNLTSLTVNHETVQSRKLDEIVSLYRSWIDEAQAEHDQAEAEFAEEYGRSPSAQELHDWINFGRDLKP